jgi:hypothetical protein
MESEGFKTFSFLILKKKSKKRPMGTPPCMQACRGGRLPKGSPKRGLGGAPPKKRAGVRAARGRAALFFFFSSKKTWSPPRSSKFRSSTTFYDQGPSKTSFGVGKPPFGAGRPVIKKII